MDDLKPIPQDTAASVQPAAITYAASQPILSLPTNLPSPAFDALCTEIVREQARIISHRLALEQLMPIQGLSVDPQTLRCSITGDGTKVVNDVVNSFSQFFGSAAVEVCREAADRYLLKLPADNTPVQPPAQPSTV